MIKDVFRLIFSEMFAAHGFDHEVMLQRLQFGIALVTANPFIG
jgi:hypothetical protein